jgi:hypothetical protein
VEGRLCECSSWFGKAAGWFVITLIVLSLVCDQLLELVAESVAKKIVKVITAVDDCMVRKVRWADF